MDVTLHDVGPNFEGPNWNKNCQLCGQEVQRGTRFYRDSEPTPKTPSSYPIVHESCLEDKIEKEKI